MKDLPLHMNKDTGTYDKQQHHRSERHLHLQHERSTVNISTQRLTAA